MSIKGQFYFFPGFAIIEKQNKKNKEQKYGKYN